MVRSQCQIGSTRQQHKFSKPYPLQDKPSQNIHCQNNVIELYCHGCIFTSLKLNGNKNYKNESISDRRKIQQKNRSKYGKQKISKYNQLCFYPNKQKNINMTNCKRVIKLTDPMTLSQESHIVSSFSLSTAKKKKKKKEDKKERNCSTSKGMVFLTFHIFN